MKFYLRKQRWDDLCYILNGMYFGQWPGTWIWEYWNDDEGGYVRAISRADAKSRIRMKYPTATFYN